MKKTIKELFNKYFFDFIPFITFTIGVVIGKYGYHNIFVCVGGIMLFYFTYKEFLKKNKKINVYEVEDSEKNN